MTWYRHLPPFFLGVLAGVFDVAVAPWLPGAWSGVRAALPLVILLSLFSRPRRSVVAAIAAGVVLDVFQPTFGLVTLRFLAVIVAMGVVARLYLTNRSLWGSLALGGIGFLADRMSLWLVTRGVAFFGSEAIVEYRPPIVPELTWIACCIVVAFWVFALFTRRFMPLVSHR